MLRAAAVFLGVLAAGCGGAPRATVPAGAPLVPATSLAPASLEGCRPPPEGGAYACSRPTGRDGTDEWYVLGLSEGWDRGEVVRSSLPTSGALSVAVAQVLEPCERAGSGPTCVKIKVLYLSVAG